jgi:hypothetical protein
MTTDEKAKLNTTPNSRLLTVGATGAQFTTINAAIDYAKAYCSVSNRVLIFIYPGTYEEDITLMPNPGIDLIGAGIDSTTVFSHSAYPNAALYTVGSGYFQGITFKSDGSSAYGFHFESQVNPAQGKVTFVDCKFVGTYHAGVGIGMGNNTTVRFYNCEIETLRNDTAAFYAHNHPSAGNVNQFLYVNNCVITNNGGGIPIVIDNAYVRAGGTGGSDVNVMYISFNGTSARLPRIKYNRTMTETLTFIPSTSDNIVLLDSSRFTNIKGLEYCLNRPKLGGYYYVSASGRATIPMLEADLYIWDIISVHDEAFNNISSSCTVSASDQNYIAIDTSNTNVRNKSINVSIIGRPKN